MPTDQHLDTVGLLKAKVEGEIARLEPSIADRENYDDTRVRLHVKAEALRWVLREIEALPPVGVGEEKGMGPEVVPEGSSRSGRSQAAPSPGEDQPAPFLWCLHVRASDDVHPAPDYATALRWADSINYDLQKRLGDDVLLKATPAPWPWSAESHASGLTDAIAEWTPPDGGAPSPSTTGPVNPDVIPTKTPSPPSPLGAEDLERAAREHWDARRPTYSHHWGQLTAAEKSYECDLMRAALLALGLPVEPSQ